MNIIFLDFDGVLNSVRSMVGFCEERARLLKQTRETHFDENLSPAMIRAASPEQKAIWHQAFDDNQWAMLDPVALGLLDRLCKEAPAKVVISSTWRIGRKVSHFQDKFKQLGLINIRVVSMTPRSDSGHRGREIAMWLTDSAHVAGDQIERFVILDDDSDMLPEQLDNFVHVSNKDGFLLTHYSQALKILNPQHTSLVQFERINSHGA